MVFMPRYTSANEICDGLGGLLDLSTQMMPQCHVCLCACFGRLSIESGQANSSNMMDLAHIIN